MDTVTVTDVLTKFDISGISSNLYIVAPQNLYFAISFVIKKYQQLIKCSFFSTSDLLRDFLLVSSRVLF